MASPGEMYLDLLEDSLLGVLQPPLVEIMPETWKGRLIARLMRRKGLVSAMPVDPPSCLEAGKSWPKGRSETMIGRARMRNIRNCVETVIHDRVPGDLIETGVWRGGACIYMRGILAAHNEKREVWVADSFAGLPEPSHPADKSDGLMQFLHEAKELAVSKEEVRANFARYRLLDGAVHFVEGLFRDTLPDLECQWAVIRLDGDLYESTMDGLRNLYPSLSRGGFLIVDDYDGPSKQAVEDYRREQGINEPIQDIDGNGVFWRRR
jgi:O-methyltransferase